MTVFVRSRIGEDCVAKKRNNTTVGTSVGWTAIEIQPTTAHQCIFVILCETLCIMTTGQPPKRGTKQERSEEAATPVDIDDHHGSEKVEDTQPPSNDSITTSIPNNPHPSLEFPPLYFLLRDCFPETIVCVAVDSLVSIAKAHSRQSTLGSFSHLRHLW